MLPLSKQMFLCSYMQAEVLDDDFRHRVPVQLARCADAVLVAKTLYVCAIDNVCVRVALGERDGKTGARTVRSFGCCNRMVGAPFDAEFQRATER